MHLGPAVLLIRTGGLALALLLSIQLNELGPLVVNVRVGVRDRRRDGAVETGGRIALWLIDVAGDRPEGELVNEQLVKDMARTHVKINFSESLSSENDEYCNLSKGHCH